jgi:hypothetical protein
MIVRRPRRRAAVLLGAPLVLALSLGAAACAPPPPSVYDAACAGTLVASIPGAVADSTITELSGIAASRRNPGVWWIVEDSGNPAAVHAIGDGGAALGTFTLQGASNVDWEDVAVGPGPGGPNYLYVGDIGGNSTPTQSNRTSIVVYRVPEPVAPGSGTLTGVEAITLTYPGGAKYDAEALVVDPVSGALYVITKQAFSARVFRAAGSGVLQLVATLSIPGVPGGITAVTGADVTPDGGIVGLRVDEFPSSGNGLVLLYPRPSGGALHDAFGQPRCSGATGAELQGEAIGFTPDGRGYVTVSEGTNPPLHRFRAP